MTSSIVLVTGGFDPLHSGHIAYFKSAKAIAPLSPLAVGLNSDEWLSRKKGKPFMPFSERKILIQNLRMVDEIMSFEDDDFGSCSKALEKVKKMYPNDTIIFLIVS